VICARGLLSFFLLTLIVDAQTPGQLPVLSTDVPKVGEKAPDFSLPDGNEKPVKLSDVLAGPAPGMTGRKGTWVLLVFYRGYW
jgi:hypothetical protein